MHTKNCSITTLEQSEMLVKSGLDPETADGHYWSGPSQPGSHYASDTISIHTPYAEAIKYAGMMNLKNEVVPTIYKPIWTEGKLIKLMPKRIKYKGRLYDLKLMWIDTNHLDNEDAELKPALMYSNLSKGNLRICRDIHMEGFDRYKTDNCETVLECAIKMTTWLLEAGYMDKYRLPASSAENMDQTEYFHQPEDDKEDKDD